jgi:hypothetical protein
MMMIILINNNCLFNLQMIGGRNIYRNASRRSSMQIARSSLEAGDSATSKRISPRRRRACTTVADYKSCALIQTRLKLGELV